MIFAQFIKRSKRGYFISGLILGYLVGSSSLLILMAIIGCFVFYDTKLPFLSAIKSALAAFANPGNENINVLSAKIDGAILLEIEAYCEWAALPDLASFIEKASCLVFAKDKEWITHQKQTGKSLKLRKVC